MKTSLVLATLLALALVGCKKKGGDCEAAIDHSMELSKADIQKMPGLDRPSDLKRLKELTVKRCTEDKWPDAALTCMSDAKTEADAQTCYGKLSAEQQQKMNQAAMDARRVPTTAPAGSDLGSAGAGSAPAMGGSAAAPQ